MKAMIVLQDGTSFDGVSVGSPGEKIGEVVLNTAVVGYQEMMTDPTNAGKILVLTYPLAGNYGVAKKFNESSKCRIAGLVIKEASRIYSNWQAEGSFEGFLKEEKVTAISDVDTRTLAITIRDKGEMLGIISTSDLKKESLIKKLKGYTRPKTSLIKDISVKNRTRAVTGAHGPDIAVLDLGMLNSFTHQLKTLGCNVTMLPYDTDAASILEMRPDGLVISNGPEDGAAMDRVADTVRSVLGKIPLFGIATGHQVIGIALGGKIKKMKVGHHGVNYPVRADNSFKGAITVQNHSFVLDDNSIKNKKSVTVTLRNVNDRTIEAMESKTLKFISVQYYPSSPGFDEANEAFARFVNMAKPSRGTRTRKIPNASNEVTYAKA